MMPSASRNRANRMPGSVRKTQTVGRGVATEIDNQAVETIVAVKDILFILPLYPELKSVGLAGRRQCIQVEVIVCPVETQSRAVLASGPRRAIHERSVVTVARDIMYDRAGAFVKGISDQQSGSGRRRSHCRPAHRRRLRRAAPGE